MIMTLGLNLEEMGILEDFRHCSDITKFAFSDCWGMIWKKAIKRQKDWLQSICNSLVRQRDRTACLRCREEMTRLELMRMSLAIARRGWTWEAFQKK